MRSLGEMWLKEIIQMNFAIKLMKVPDELDIPFSVNNIIGFPGETRRTCI